MPRALPLVVGRHQGHIRKRQSTPHRPKIDVCDGAPRRNVLARMPLRAGRKRVRPAETTPGSRDPSLDKQEEGSPQATRVVLETNLDQTTGQPEVLPLPVQAATEPSSVQTVGQTNPPPSTSTCEDPLVERLLRVEQAIQELVSAVGSREGSLAQGARLQPANSSNIRARAEGSNDADGAPAAGDSLSGRKDSKELERLRTLVFEFAGSQPDKWIRLMEAFFRAYRVPEERKALRAKENVSGDVRLKWYEHESAHNPTWEV
ncbi:hypothetical protein Emed_007502 [Eimeria media]